MELLGYRTVVGFLSGVGILLQVCDSDVKCRNDDGHEVDWYILYKLPNLSDGGLSYLYMDDSTGGWRLSKETISSKSGCVANTLRPLLDFYKKKSEGFGYVLYNDQPPDPYFASASFGHSKGVVMLDRHTGVWLSHSTPKFPGYRTKDFWPSSGNANAQTFLCVTYSHSAFREIALQLQYIHAYSYDSDVPKTFYNELKCVAQRSCYPKREPWFRAATLTSLGGHSFRSFAKYKRFGNDLYSGLIAPSVKQTLYVKSWGKMRRPLPSNCSVPHRVLNVREVRPRASRPFGDTVDHSKWCVTARGGCTCVADMNREERQMDRGGGALCTEDAAVQRAFYELITQHEKCENHEHPEL